jgi:hypothetical protein
VLPREIGADNLPANVGGRQIHFDTLLAALPVRIREETPQNFRGQIAFTLEIIIEAAVRQSRASHDLVQQDIIKATAIK